MALRRFTDDVNVISALPDVPSPPEYNASILKAKFDEAAVQIKALQLLMIQEECLLNLQMWQHYV